MTKEDIIMHIKHIVVEQCEKDPEDRDIFAAFGALIDKIEDSIEEDYAQWRRDSGDPTYGDEGA
jgi:hypothetical protein